MACSIEATPCLDLLIGHKRWTASNKQQLKGHQTSYSCFSKTPKLPVLSLQSRDKAVMLVVKNKPFLPRIYIKMVFREKCFVVDPARTWPP